MFRNVDVDKNGNEDKYDHITFNVPIETEITTLMLRPTSDLGSYTLQYRIQQGTALDLNGTDLVTGTITQSDIDNETNLLLNGIKLTNNDYAMLIYSQDSNVDYDMYYKISREPEPVPEPAPKTEQEPEPESETEPGPDHKITD